MRTIYIEVKRMLLEKRLLWFLLVTVIYVTVCSMFFNLRFKLDYDYEKVHYEISAFKLWQDNMGKSFMIVLLQIVPSMIYVFSFMDDRKNGIDSQICLRRNGCGYYFSKFITVMFGGMLFNFLTVMITYFPCYFLLSTGCAGWNDLDRNNTVVGTYFHGNTAMEFVFLVAVSYAFVGGVCAGLSFIFSMWMENRVLVCILPYIVFHVIKSTSFLRDVSKIFFFIIAEEVDVFMADWPFHYGVYRFIGWNLFLGILFLVSDRIRIKSKK